MKSESHNRWDEAMVLRLKPFPPLFIFSSNTSSGHSKLGSIPCVVRACEVRAVGVCAVSAREEESCGLWGARVELYQERRRCL